MAYDEMKDECLAHVGGFRAGEHPQVIARIMRYDGGRAKLALNRLVDTKRGVSTRQLGRIEADEITYVIELLKKAQPMLDEVEREHNRDK